MEDNDDWLSNNKTRKKWTRIGDGESLSYAGINFHKPIDEEQLVKEIKRRKKLNEIIHEKVIILKFNSCVFLIKVKIK